MSDSGDAETDKINENIKKRQEMLDNEVNYFSEFANLVAFFQTDIKQYLANSLCEHKWKMGNTLRLPELHLWIDIHPNLQPTKILIDVVNGYLKFLNSILCDSNNFDFSKSKFPSAHFTFDEILKKHYEKVLISLSFNFPVISPLKVNESNHRKSISYNDRLTLLINNHCLNTKISNIDGRTIDKFPQILTNYTMYENDNKIDILKQIYTDLRRNSQELTNFLSDEQSCNINVRDFIYYPPIDIIKSSPQYQQYLNYISQIRNQVQTDFKELNAKISSLFISLNNCQRKLEKSFAFPQINFDELSQISNEYSNLIKDNLITAFYYKVMKKINPSDQDSLRVFLKKLFKKFQALSKLKDLNAIRSSLKEIQSILSQGDFEKIFKQQEKDQLSIQKEFKEALSRESPKSNIQRPPDAEEHLSKKREEITSLSKRYTSQRNEIHDQLLQSIEEFITKLRNIQYCPLFPEQIEQMNHTISIQAANMDLETRRLENQRKEKQKSEESIQKLNERLSQLKIEIQNKKKEIATLKAKQGSSKISNSNSPCLCLHCHQAQIVSMISKCGHSFCSDCISDKEACPICGETITKFDVVEIHWF